MERCQKPMEENLKVQNEAIALEEQNAQETGKPKSDLLGRLYRIKAQILEYLKRNDESVVACNQALEVYEKQAKTNTGTGENAKEVVSRLRTFIKQKT